MAFKFIGTSVVLQRKHKDYTGTSRVKAHFFESSSRENIIIKCFDEGFRQMTRTKPVIMNHETFNKLPPEPEAKADRVLKLMGWE